ncbi:MAG: DUF3078 domain-containing protein [Bacteroidales bacterium]|nr:DUF3078 domain-containing protein [Bacteroidales bacterium]
MRTKLGFLIIGLIFSYAMFAQENNRDTLLIKKIDPISIQSVPVLKDNHTIKKEIKFKNQDMINVDSLISDIDTLYSIQADSLEKILLRHEAQNNYLYFIKHLSDSLLFYTPDTTDFVIHQIHNLLSDSFAMSDSLKQAIYTVIQYYQSQKIQPSISYLRNTIYSDSIFSISDTSYSVKKAKNLLKAIDFVIKKTPEDSLNLVFYNSQKDSVFMGIRKSQPDSLRINLYDKRGESATLWIKKNEGNKFVLDFEDGVYINKTKRRKGVKQKIDTYFYAEGLKKVKKVNIIVPIWKYKSITDIRFNQGYLENWAEGGENSISTLGILKFDLDYLYGKRINWESTLEYKLGYIKAGENSIQKNEDKLEFNSKFGKKAYGNWYYSALLNFKTQILKGFDYTPEEDIPISEFLSPAYLVFSIGMDYKPNKKFTVLVSPLTSKLTIVADTVNYDQTLFDLAEDELVRKEFGAYVKAISKIKIKDNIELINKVNFFTNYMDNPQNIDVDIEADLTVKLSESIKLAINAHLIYDDNVSYVDKDDNYHGPRIQFKEMLGIGFIYMFKN